MDIQVLTEHFADKDLIQLQLSLSVLLAQTTDIEDGLQTGLDIALQSAGMECGLIYLLDKHENKLNLCVHRGMSDEFIEKHSQYEIQPGMKIRCKSSEVCIKTLSAELAKEFKDVITLPIFASEKILGCINLASHNTNMIPVPVHIQLKTISALLGNAICRIQIQNELQKTRNNMMSLLECASGFVVYWLVIDQNSPYKLRRTHISPSIEQILGYDPKKYEVKDFFENIHPGDRELVMEAYKEALITNRFETQVRIYHPLKEEFVWIHTICVGVQDDNGEITHVNGVLIDVSEKQHTRAELNKKEKDLEIKTGKLNRLNTTLNTLLEKRNNDRSEIEQSLVFNVKEMILPYIEKIRKTSSANKRKIFLDAVETNLNDITSRFIPSISVNQLGLSPTEIKVAAYVKRGKSTKEIAELLGSSEKTVKNQRLRIRKKLGISSKKINLRSYLSSLKL
jgi:PAS domain S-box-containing protein